MNTRDTLLAYSEWLDSEKLIVSDHMSRQEGKALDGRPHDQLAQEFIEQWEGEPLAGDLGGLLADMEALAQAMERDTEYGTMPGVRMQVREHWAGRLRGALPTSSKGAGS